MLGKIGDHAAILVAAILTVCGVALAFMPWGALSPHAPPPVPKAQNPTVFVDMGTSGAGNSGAGNGAVGRPK